MARGSIRERGRAEGTAWEARVDLGIVDGRRQQRARTFRTRKEAEKALSAWLVEIDRGTAIDRSGQTMADLLEYWLATHVRDRLKAKTVADYEWLTAKHILPVLGRVVAQRLTPDRLQRFYADKRASGVGVRTIQLCHLCIHQALKLATRQEMVARNVADLVSVPRQEKPEMQTWDRDQARAFLCVAHESIYGPLWLLALATGMRRGELLGLRWQDVDLDGGVLQIRKTIGVANGHLIHGTPKTKSSRRSVLLPDPLPAVLRLHKVHQHEARLRLGAAWRASDLVFTTSIGTPIHPDNPRHDLKRLTERAGVPRIRIHAMRHSFVSIGLAEGADPKALSESIGHVDTREMYKTYAHVFAAQRQAVARTVSAALFPDPAPDAPDAPETGQRGSS